MKSPLIKLFFSTWFKSYLFLIALAGFFEIVSGESYLNYSSVVFDSSPKKLHQKDLDDLAYNNDSQVVSEPLVIIPKQQSRKIVDNHIRCIGLCNSSATTKTNKTTVKKKTISKTQGSIRSHSDMPKHYLSSADKLKFKPTESSKEEKMTRVRKVSIDGDTESVRHYLPGGPPPFRPTALMVGVASTGALKMLKSGIVFKRMYKSKLYYWLLDLLQQMTLATHQLAHKKEKLTIAKLDLIKAAINQIASKGGQSLKLYWPLVLLNPAFLKEIYSSPILLVMLLHAGEEAYMSSPTKFWMKPFLKLVEQPSREKEDRIWWKRKRIYESLFGAGTSEVEPSLQTAHFQVRGKKMPIIKPHLAKLMRYLAGLPIPQATFYQQPKGSHTSPSKSIPNSPTDLSPHLAASLSLGSPKFPGAPHQQVVNKWLSSPPQQSLSETDLQVPYYSKLHQSTGEDNTELIQPPNEAKPSELSSMTNYLGPLEADTMRPRTVDRPYGYRSFIMSRDEFNSLDSSTKARLLEEARQTLDESVWTDELIKQQTDLIQSIVGNQKQFGGGATLPVDQALLEPGIRKIRFG